MNGTKVSPETPASDSLFKSDAEKLREALAEPVRDRDLEIAPSSGEELPVRLVRVLISDIVRDAGTQSRQFISEPTVADYVSDIKDGATFPPIDVFEGPAWWLADGFHRVAAAERAGETTIAANIHQGTLRDAILFAVGCNGQHGLKRSNADKRQSVNMLLRDEEWAGKSDRWIAEKCGVSDHLVADIRKPSTAHSRSSRTGKDGKTRKPPKRRKRSVPEHVPPIDEPATQKPVGEKLVERSSGGVELEQLQDAFDTHVVPQLEVVSRAIQDDFAKWVVERCDDVLGGQR